MSPSDTITNFGSPETSKSDLDILNSPDTPEGEVKPPVESPEKEIEENPDAPPDGEDEEETPEGETEDEEEAEEEEDESEETEDETSDTEGVDELSLYKQLKKADPEIFKKFPELRTTLFREQKYSEMFPTVEDAVEAHGKLKNVDMLEADLLDGNPENLFEAIAATDKDSGKGSFAKLAMNILPAIYKQDKDAYTEILRVPIKRAIQNVYLQAKKAGNDNLANSALYLDQFYFGEDGIGTDPKSRLATETKKSPEQQKWEKEKQEHEEKIQNDFKDQVYEVIKTKLDREIFASIEKLEFDPYKRKNVVRDIVSEVNNLLASDKRYQASIRSLWNQAQSARFNGDWKARITNAFLARAKAVLPIAKKKVIDEATGRVIKDKKLIKRLTPSNSSGVKPAKFDINRIDKTKTTDADLLSDDPGRIKYKGK